MRSPPPHRPWLPLLCALWAAGAAASTPPGEAPDRRSIAALKQAFHGGDWQAILPLYARGDAGWSAVAELLLEPGVDPDVVRMQCTRHDWRPGPAAIPAFVRVLEAPEASLGARLAASTCLAAYGHRARGAIAAVRPLLDVVDTGERHHVRFVLAKLGDTTLVPELVQALNSPDAQERDAALVTLAELGPLAADARAPLEALLQSRDHEVRWGAAYALGRLRRPEAAPALTSLLGDTSWPVTWAAVESLRMIRARASVPALRKVAREYWFLRVREAAARAVRELERPSASPPVERDWSMAMDPPRGALGRWRCGQVGEAWRVRTRTGWLTLPAPDPHATRRPEGFPAVDLAFDGGYEGELQFLAVEDGWLVGRGAGEMGGGLWFVSREGRATQLSTTQVAAFVALQGRTLALAGYAHYGEEHGEIDALVRDAGGVWRSEHLLETPGGPLTWGVVGEDLVVVSTHGALELSERGEVHELECGAPKR